MKKKVNMLLLAVVTLLMTGCTSAFYGASSASDDLYAMQKTGGKEREEEKTEKRTSPDFFRPSRPSFWTEPTPCLPPIRPSNRTLTPPTKLLSKPIFGAVSKLQPHVHTSHIPKYLLII